MSSVDCSMCTFNVILSIASTIAVTFIYFQNIKNANGRNKINSDGEKAYNEAKVALCQKIDSVKAGRRVPIWPVMQYSGYSTMDPYATVYNLEMFRQRSAAFIEEMLPQRSAGAVTTSVTNMCLLNKERVDEISKKSSTSREQIVTASRCELRKDSKLRSTPKRIMFSEKQVAVLVRHFEQQSYLGHTARKILSQALNLTELQVDTWFRNRRNRITRNRNRNAIPLTLNSVPRGGNV